MSHAGGLRRPGMPRRRTLVLLALGLFFVLVALVALAIPMTRVPNEAQAAKDDLTQAKAALQAGDLPRAEALVASARGHIDAAEGGVNGFGSDVWHVVPVARTAVGDARNLVQALDDATSVAEIGIDLYPAAIGKDATLFEDQQVDKATLDRVIDGARRADEHLASAEAALDDVHGSTPFVGDTIAARRDEAAAQVDPLADTFANVSPMLDQLPTVFGFEGRRSYLVALLNPAELRYSGGATLKFAPLLFDQGKVELGPSIQPTDEPRLNRPRVWPKVFRNTFHRPGPHRLTAATFAPSWSVSGEELLRAWKATRNVPHAGVVAIDVVALSRLLEVTGPVTIPGYGDVTSDTLVKTLIGSYDQYYPDPTVQDSLNDALIPAFKSAFFDGGNYVEKARALGAAADERHFAMYSRDEAVEEGFAALGLTGDLSEPDGDYLGVFTQNATPSKVDYYQRRSVALDVTLDDSGSAQHRVGVVVDNDTPPYAVPGTDPQTGYFTRWSGLSLGTFVPRAAKIQSASVAGEPVDLHFRKFYRHAFAAADMVLAPATSERFAMTYDVPGVATVDDDGELTYRLSYDPQGTVQPQSVAVTVHLPEGYVVTTLPGGWSADGDTVTLPLQDLTTSQQWEIVAKPGS